MSVECAESSEDSWDLIEGLASLGLDDAASPAPEPASASFDDAPSPAQEPAPTSSLTPPLNDAALWTRGADCGPRNVYCVWEIRGHPQVRGVFVCIWKRLQALLPGCRYLGSGARLRRYPTVELAEAAFPTQGPAGDKPWTTWTLP